MESLKTESQKTDGQRLAELAAEAKQHLSGPRANSIQFFKGLVGSLTKEGAFPGEPDAKAACLLDAANFFYLAGQPFEGIGAATVVVALVRTSGEKLLLRRGLSCLGVMHADSGNLPLAIECYAEAVELALLIGDRKGEVATWLNLGAALLLGAQYGEAINCLDRVLELVGTDEAGIDKRSQALCNIALCYYHMDDHRNALKALAESEKGTPPPSTASEHLSVALRELTFTRSYLELNNIQQAKEHSQAARRSAGRATSGRAEIAASLAEGLYEVHAGMTDIGLSRLTNAVEKARLVRSWTRSALISLVKAYETAGQPEKALVYLRELLEFTRKSNEEYALIHQRLHLEKIARLDEFSPTVAVAPLQRREAVLRGKVAEQELLRSRLEMLERLAVAAELRDDSTGEHSYRVGKLAALIAQVYGCDDDTIFMLDLAGRLHDIGKIGVPDAILLKPARLNSAEIQIMRAHTTVGAELLAKSNVAQMQMAEEIARYHHEWWDGSGYPANISGTAIPISARITALADVFDALTHRRPYKEAWPIEEALAEIASLSGRQFDPELCHLFLRLVPDLQRQHGDLDAFLGQAAKQSSFLQARSKIWTALAQSRSADFDNLPFRPGFSLD